MEVAGGVRNEKMRFHPVWAVFADSGTFLFSAQKLASSEGFDKSPYAVPPNTPQTAPSSMPFWPLLLLLLLLLLNPLLSSIQNQDSELQSQGGAFQDHGGGLGRVLSGFSKRL